MTQEVPVYVCVHNAVNLGTYLLSIGTIKFWFMFVSVVNLVAEISVMLPSQK